LDKWPINRNWITGRAVMDKMPIHVHDLLSAEGNEFPEAQQIARRQGHRTILSVPLLRENGSIGAIVLRRTEVAPFGEKQIALLQTFADQAVIALDNVRLFDEVQARTRELTEALTYQTGSANILRVIASSPTEVGPVLQAIVASACELCDAVDALVLLKDGDNLRHGAHHGPIPYALEKWPINRNWASACAFLDRKPVHVHDVFSAEGDEFPDTRERARRTGTRTYLCVPLLREGESIGTIVLRRTEVHPFNEKQIALLQTFADQAVIAIGNVRLFDEVQAKTRDLTEALTYQTGSSNILKVIASSPTDVGPVLKAIVESACELCEADDALVTLRDGDDLLFKAQHGSIPVAWERMPINRQWASGRAVVDRKPVHVHDLHANEGEPFPDSQELARRTSVRTVLSVPLLRENESIGAIVLRRTEVQPFSDKQISLLQTFADQAVIAIGNVRLFDEVQARTEDLRESLQVQTATSEVLRVISRSPDALQPVLDAIVETSRELCGSDGATIFLLRERKFHFTAASGAVPKHLEFLRTNPAPIDGPTTVFTRVAQQKRTTHYPHVTDDPELQGRSDRGGPRALLVAPLMRDGEVIGTIILRQSDLKPFTPRQIEAIETFADQAVIAISNVGLFEQVQERTRDLTESLQQQTATADVLKVISRSTFDLKTVLDALIGSAAQLCDANAAHIYLREAEVYKLAACAGFSDEYEEFMRAHTLVPGRGTLIGRTALEGRIVRIPDALNDPEYEFKDAQSLGGFRTMLGIPMLRDGAPIGVLAMTRSEVRPFTDKQIDLVTTFADQAVIAIENVRLFVEVQERTKELSQSLDELRTAQDRLVQTEKLASLGQLTAGIAHEIKNPLNFVNNFSALSAELTDELNDLLRSAVLTDKLREEVDELTETLKDNLQKVVQHGKRADSIVKNMLLHSREGSGEHRPADINAILDESLNLAYHGARAEKREFNVTLQRDFDEMAGTIEVFPQEITRVFLNLISNGFYAVAKRKTENGGSDFEPVVRATTRSLGDTVEIRIRDNGTGIPAEVREKMFNPFFTTKPAGEGTGLGLSMSHDIIVKQHGGRIDVETEPGQFTEFRIVLPRTKNLSDKNRGQT
jgi:GAF domain-containing protein